MKGLIAILYFMACGYLFAKYEGDKILLEAGRRVFRELATEAALISRHVNALPPGPVVVDLSHWEYRAATQAAAGGRAEAPAVGWWEEAEHG